MNLVDLFLIVLIALTVFVGIKRGLLISLLSALRFIVSIPLSFFVGNNYNEIIYKMNAVIEYLKNNGGYDYKLYNRLCPGMGEPDSNIVEYAEDILYIINLLINNK